MPAKFVNGIKDPTMFHLVLGSCGIVYRRQTKNISPRTNYGSRFSMMLVLLANLYTQIKLGNGLPLQYYPARMNSGHDLALLLYFLWSLAEAWYRYRATSRQILKTSAVYRLSPFVKGTRLIVQSLSRNANGTLCVPA